MMGNLSRIGEDIFVKTYNNTREWLAIKRKEIPIMMVDVSGETSLDIYLRQTFGLSRKSDTICAKIESWVYLGLDVGVTCIQTVDSEEFDEFRIGDWKITVLYNTAPLQMVLTFLGTENSISLGKDTACNASMFKGGIVFDTLELEAILALAMKFAS